MFPGQEESTGSQIQAGNLCLERRRVRAPNILLMKCRNKSLWGVDMRLKLSINLVLNLTGFQQCVILLAMLSLEFILSVWPILVCDCAPRCAWWEFSPFFLLLQNPDRTIPVFMASGLIWEDWRDNMNMERSGEQNLTFGLKYNRLRPDHWSNVQTPLSFVLEINTMGRSECLQPIWELRQKGRMSSPGRNMWHSEDNCSTNTSKTKIFFSRKKIIIFWDKLFRWWLGKKKLDKMMYYCSKMGIKLDKMMDYCSKICPGLSFFEQAQEAKVVFMCWWKD